MANNPTTDDLHRLPTDEDLGRLQWTTVLYYLHETNPDNGLVRDKTDLTALRRVDQLADRPPEQSRLVGSPGRAVRREADAGEDSAVSGSVHWFCVEMGGRRARRFHSIHSGATAVSTP
jgi:hypothetical protein